MEVYSVNISDVALADMESIYNYIAKTLLAPESALRQYNRIANAILSLDTLPERYPFFDLEPEYSWRMRKMVVDNNIVCYIVDPGIVTVTDVLYGAANVHSWLKRRHKQGR